MQFRAEMMKYHLRECVLSLIRETCVELICTDFFVSQVVLLFPDCDKTLNSSQMVMQNNSEVLHGTSMLGAVTYQRNCHENK